MIAFLFVPTTFQLLKQITVNHLAKEKFRSIDAKKPLLDADGHNSILTHRYTYFAVVAFTVIVYFRPQEAYPSLVLLESIAFWVATLTLLLYVVTQLNATGSLTAWTTEVKCAVIMTVSALITIPIAIDPARSWETFNDPFVKVMAMFVVMANTLTNERRIKGLMWLGVAIGAYLSYQTYGLYTQGVFNIEGYRVAVNFGGMFGNPNDMSIHLVMFIPIAIAMGLANGNVFIKIVLYAAGGLMAIAISFTQSRSGFIGLLAVVAILVWRLGRGRRVKAILLVGILSIGFISFAPGNYGVRLLSIFVPALDATGSSDGRRDSLNRSLLVTLRNPQGIGIGNTPIVGFRNLETHNAYTQVSSELGWIAFGAYAVLLVYPLRRLSKIEKKMSNLNERTLLYYLVVGTHAGIVGYMVSSFFASVAYLWYVYYPLAYAVGLRTIYELRVRSETDSVAANDNRGDIHKLAAR